MAEPDTAVAEGTVEPVVLLGTAAAEGIVEPEEAEPDTAVAGGTVEPEVAEVDTAAGIVEPGTAEGTVEPADIGMEFEERMGIEFEEHNYRKGNMEEWDSPT